MRTSTTGDTQESQKTISYHPQVIELACKDHLRLGLDIRPSRAQAMFLEFLRAEMSKQKQMPSRSSARRWSQAGLLLVEHLHISQYAVTVIGPPDDRMRAHGE